MSQLSWQLPLPLWFCTLSDMSMHLLCRYKMVEHATPANWDAVVVVVYSQPLWSLFMKLRLEIGEKNQGSIFKKKALNFKFLTRMKKMWVYVLVSVRLASWIAKCLHVAKALSCDFFTCYKYGKCQTLHDGSTHSALPIHSTLSDMIVFQGHSSVKGF